MFQTTRDFSANYIQLYGGGAEMCVRPVNADVQYEDFKGRKLDGKMLELLKK
ncbi:MAG: hypothetical protein NVS9B4_23080 [Candidatus Acidiferrum sp.]